MKVLRTIAVTVLTLVVLTFALLGLLLATRGTPLTRVTGFGADDQLAPIGSPTFRAMANLYADTELETGHDVRILADGDGTFPLLLAELAGARRTIAVQIYYADPGAFATRFREALEARARAGVRVLYLYDAFGSTLSDAYHDSLAAAGVEVAEFRPVKWYSLHKAQNRAHTRAVVIDGTVGYTGGFGIADKWWLEGPDEWRETNVRFTGPAVRRLQAAFGTAWVEATGTLLTGAPFFVPADTTGSAIAGLVYSAPALGSSVAERLFALTIAGARERLYIANAYFVPDDDFRRLLVAAAERGVDVRLLVPGHDTDVPIVRLAGRGIFEELLRGGVRVYEYTPTMMHAKTLSADGVWTLIGTANFDNRSMAMNEEVVLAVDDAGVAADHDRLFLADLGRARELTLDRFAERGWFEKLKEKGALTLSRLL